MDFGAGDGKLAYRLAKDEPSKLVLALDANAAALVEISQRAAAKLSRGGVPNLLAGRLALTEAPSILGEFADSLSVVLPWRSLLEAVATGEVANLRAMLKSGGRFQALFGYSSAADPDVKLPELTKEQLRRMEQAYAQAGLPVKARLATLEEVKATPSTWAKKLAHSGKSRIFVALEGNCQSR